MRPHYNPDWHVASWLWRGSDCPGVEAAATIRRQPGIFEQTRQSLLRRCRLFIEVGGRTFEHLLEISTKYTFFFFSEYFSGFAWFPSLIRPYLTVHSAARTHLRHTVAWQWIFVMVPPVFSRSLGMEFFRTLYTTSCVSQQLNHYRNQHNEMINVNNSSLCWFSLLSSGFWHLVQL
jgi:hypothetical protein